MIYATLSDLSARAGTALLVELTDRVNVPPVTVDAARVDLALADASALMDGYVGQVYRLPLAGCLKPAETAGAEPTRVPPPLLVRLCCDLALPALYTHYLPDEHEVSQRRRQALRDLEAMAKAKLVLSCPWGGEPGQVLGETAQTAADVAYSFGARAVTDADLEGF